MVIGNLLHTRKTYVMLIDRFNVEPDEIRLSSTEQEAGTEIEEKIIGALKTRHEQYIADHKTG